MLEGQGFGLLGEIVLVGVAFSLALGLAIGLGAVVVVTFVGLAGKILDFFER